MSNGRKPLHIIPDPEFEYLGYESSRVASALGSFRAGTGMISFHSDSIRNHLNIQRMFQLFSTGVSPNLVGRGMNSEDILVQTSVTHEMRHFHDTLLSFTFLEAARRKLFLSVNSVELFRRFPNMKNTYLPTPLLDWITKDGKARQEQLRKIASFFGSNPPAIFPLPFLSLDQLEKGPEPSDPLQQLILVCARSAITIRTLLRGFAFSQGVRAIDIYELSAISIQLRAIIDRFGINAAKDIYFGNIQGTYYDDVLSQIDILVSGDKDQQIYGLEVFLLASAMTFWAFCSGPPEPLDTNMADACPSVRFYRLRNVLAKDRVGLMKALLNPDDLLDYFDSVMKEKSTKERIEKSTSYFEDFTTEISQRVSKLPGCIQVALHCDIGKSLFL